MDRKMEVFSRRLRDVRREIRKEMEDLKDEIMFREEDWKRERNELKERIEKLETRRVEYNENGQNNTRQLEQENNTRNSSSLITSTSSTFRSQGARPASGNYEGTSRCNSDGIANNWSAGTSGTPARNAQSQNSNVAKPNGSNRPNVASTVSDTRENNSFRIKSDDANRSTNKSNQSAPENSHNVNNTTSTDDDSAKIMCHCRKPAIQLVKKDEQCKVSEPRVVYYKCANYSNKSQGSRCDFVLWAFDSANQSQSNATDEYSSSISKDINKLEKKLNQSAPGNSRNANNTTNTDDDSAKIMCHCRKPAIQLVKKDELCKERRYYKCANSNKSQGIRCDFVLWASDSANQSQSKVTDEYSSSTSKDINKLVKKLNQYAPGNSRNANNTTNTDDDSAKIMCHCRKPAIQLVKKDELCKERRYYKCANSNKSQEIRCDFVLWASDSANQSQSNATDEYSSSTSKDINKLVKKLNQSAPGNSRNANNTTNTDDDSAKIIMCHCRKPAIKLAKKEGSYKGRLYYKCANKLFGSRCNFFLSASDSTKSRDNVANDYSSSVFNMDKSSKSAGTSNNKLRNLFTSNVMCNCNRPALKVKAQAGPDKQSCYVCPNSICHFVKWENIDSRKNTNRSNYNSRALKIPKTESKRRCGICRREDHTRINCPARR